MKDYMIQKWGERWLVGIHPFGPNPKGALSWNIRLNDIVGDCATKEAAESILKLYQEKE